MKRQNVKADFSGTVSKSSSAYIADVKYGRELQPAFIRLSDEDCWKFYRYNEWINATVNRIVQDCIAVEPMIVPSNPDSRITPGMQKRIDKVRRFLDNPNDNKESFADIREKVGRDLLVYGRGAVEKVLTESDRRVREIYSVRGSDIVVNADARGNLPKNKAYTQKPKNRMQEDVNFDYDELIFMVFQPTSATKYGTKPLDALANTVASDILRSAYNSNFFVNNGESSGIISLEGMNKVELKKFKQYWEDHHKGAKNAHKVAAVNVPVNWIRMAITNRDMEFGDYGVELRTKIFSVFNMQPVVMGVIDPTTGKLNSGYQIDLYKDGALRPILRKESYYYTHEIINMGFGFTDIKLAFPSIDLADKQTQAEIDHKYVTSAVITINEVRQHNGMAPVPWGDAPISITPGSGSASGANPGNESSNNDNSDNNGDAEDDSKQVDFISKKAEIVIEACLENYSELKNLDVNKILSELTENVKKAKKDRLPLEYAIPSELDESILGLIIDKEFKNPKIAAAVKIFALYKMCGKETDIEKFLRFGE